jgi:hypothetical protein
MDFALTLEHEMVAKMVRDFAEKQVAPVLPKSNHCQLSLH